MSTYNTYTTSNTIIINYVNNYFVLPTQQPIQRQVSLSSTPFGRNPPASPTYIKNKPQTQFIPPEESLKYMPKKSSN